jgi:hypothetical protein
MNNLVIKYFFPAILFLNICFAQQLTIKDNSDGSTVNSLSLNNQNRISIIKDENINKAEIERIFLSYQSSLSQKKQKEFSTFDVVSSSFRSNIRFGGFWDKYAIINFTPQMNLKPFDFVSIYASHNMSCFIPIKGVKEHFKSMAIQSAAIMAVESSLKFLLPEESVVKSILGFALKNAIIFYFMKPYLENTKGENQILEYDQYYYSMSIRLNLLH